MSISNKYSSSDKKWGRLNKKSLEAACNGNWFLAGTTYYKMARQLAKEGKDNSRQKQIGYEMKLRSAQQALRRIQRGSVVKKVEVLASLDSCEHCQKINGKLLSVTKALEENPIPVRACNQKKGFGCRCIYIPVVE